MRPRPCRAACTSRRGDSSPAGATSGIRFRRGTHLADFYQVTRGEREELYCQAVDRLEEVAERLDARLEVVEGWMLLGEVECMVEHMESWVQFSTLAFGEDLAEQ